MLRANVSDSGEKTAAELGAVKKSILELMNKIKTISENSCQTETMVQEITRDIKSFDLAKRNLSNSITLLRRLQLVSNAIDQLAVIGKNKQYVETSQILAATVNLMKSLITYKGVPKIKAYFDNLNAIQLDLKKQILQDFEEGFVNGQLRAAPNNLREACMVIDAFEFDAKKNGLCLPYPSGRVVLRESVERLQSHF